MSLELCCSMIGADALRASNDHEEQRLSPQGGQVHRKCAELLCSSRRARVSPSTACDYATAPPFIRAASRCVSFVEGYRSMWLQPVEQCTQRATTPVKACGKKGLSSCSSSSPPTTWIPRRSWRPLTRTFRNPGQLARFSPHARSRHTITQSHRWAQGPL